jgi:hypothetical protein
MSGSDPTEKKSGAMIWLLGIVVVIVIGATMREKPITIAAGDDPPSISTPATGFDPSRTSMREQGAREQVMRSAGSRSGTVPLGQPAPQLSYNGWSVPQHMPE